MNSSIMVEVNSGYGIRRKLDHYACCRCRTSVSQMEGRQGVGGGFAFLTLALATILIP